MRGEQILPGTGRGTGEAGGGGGPQAVYEEENPLRQRYSLPPPRPGEDFCRSAARLAGLSGILFAWLPDTFWSATPAELAGLVAALTGDTADPPDAAIIAQLKEAFPDG